MKRAFTFISVIMLGLLSACNTPIVSTVTPLPATSAPATPEPPQPSPTSPPVTEPTTLPPTTRLAMLASDNRVKIVELRERVTNPNFPGVVLPRGGVAGDAVYYMDFNTPEGGAKRVTLDGSEQRLDFIRNPNYSLGVWPGDAQQPPRLGWGTYPDVSASPRPSEIWVSGADGADAQPAYALALKPEAPSHLLFERWSADGQSFYFSQEPWGIGGYLILSGASSLYFFNAADGSVADIVPFNLAGQALCLDDFYGEVFLVVDHCGTPTLNIHDRGTGQTTTIEAPASGAVTEHTAIGSARFSPNGQRVAFALARGNPEDEQGWVAVSDGLSGGSRLVWSGEMGGFYTVIGWLNDEALLVQWTGATETSVWVVNANSAAGYPVADGNFLALVR